MSIRDIVTGDDGAHGVDALVLIGAERAIGYRYSHRVFLRRVAVVDFRPRPADSDEGHRVFLRRVAVVDFRPRPADSDEGFLVGYIKAEIVDAVAQSFGAYIGSGGAKA
ncbi:hypothetical protein V491_01429 [Pseudogymnoascus sp. VKM F-3775]|nr:hypothetical protein V491_01429 [Pseudogymnoascus sp. VKM F-3775]